MNRRGKTVQISRLLLLIVLASISGCASSTKPSQDKGSSACPYGVSEYQVSNGSEIYCTGPEDSDFSAMRAEVFDLILKSCKKRFELLHYMEAIEIRHDDSGIRAAVTANFRCARNL